LPLEREVTHLNSRGPFKPTSISVKGIKPSKHHFINFKCKYKSMLNVVINILAIFRDVPVTQGAINAKRTFIAVRFTVLMYACYVDPLSPRHGASADGDEGYSV
jgi:hypothetical protein